MNIKNLNVNDVKRGYVVGQTDSDPPKEVESFTAHVTVLNHKHIQNGYTPVIDCHTSHIACTFETLISQIDVRTGKVIEENPKTLKSKDAGLIKMVPKKPVVVEAFADYPPLGRFVVRDMNRIVAFGIIKQVIRKLKN